jgi:hypothetical protein
MHFAQARHQIFAATLDPPRSGRHSGVARRSHIGDSAITYNDGPVVQNRIAVHRNHVDRDERKILRRGWFESDAKHQSHTNETQAWFHGPLR